MFRITLACYGVPTEAGAVGAFNIVEEFKYRPWHRNVSCTWDGDRLMLRAESDDDADGRVLADEFSDAIAACVAQAFDGEIKIESVIPIVESET